MDLAGKKGGIEELGASWPIVNWRFLQRWDDYTFITV
jgi:hypothetical protein